MKNLLAVCLTLGLVSTSMGREPVLLPPTVGAVSYQPTLAVSDLQPIPHGYPAPAVVQPGVIICDAAQAGQLIVAPTKVRSERKIHPCAVEKIVSVPDPCDPCKCVYVSICVPPCACEDVSVKRNRTKFDYGKYSVTVISRNGKLIVDYDN